MQLSDNIADTSFLWFDDDKYPMHVSETRNITNSTRRRYRSKNPENVSFPHNNDKNRK